MEIKNSKAEKIRWDLGFMYAGIDDPKIDEDVKTLEDLAKKFNADYKNQLAEKLGLAIEDFSKIKMLSDKIMVFLFLQQSLDVTDSAVKAKFSQVEQKLNRIHGEYLTFFVIELVALDDAVIDKACQENETVRRHKPWIDHQRIFRPHLLSEPVESALTKRASFGTSAWSEFFDECEADLQFEYQGKTKNLTEMLDILGNSKSSDERADALRLVNEGLGKNLAKYSAQTLSMVTAEMAVEGRERHYTHPMQLQNKSNNIPDGVVETLHKSVMDFAGPLAQRYYRLKAKLLGLQTLAWSDRNAPLAFTDTTIIPFDEAMDLVLKAYRSFSPTLAGIVQDFIETKKIDAPATKGKRGGAFNYSLVLPGNKAESFTFLNYLGSSRDVMTLAHELGHGVHGILAGNAQGPLMFHAPIAYCETASVFGEMTTFHFLKNQLKEKGDNAALLALLAQKIEDTLNTVVRQIGFSNFERRIHGMDAGYQTWQEPKKLSAKELNDIWLETTKELYGQEGQVFTYQNTEYLWSYVSHFHRPFYVYGYAFGELLTQSLYAQQSHFGASFESLYLDLLRSGSTKNVVELLAPFNLNPSDEDFWAKGIKVGLEAMIDEVEILAKEILA